MKRILYALSHHQFHFACVLLLGLALNAIFAMTDPLVMKLLIDEGMGKGEFKLLGLCSALVVAVGVVTAEERDDLQNLALKYYRLGSLRLGFTSVTGS